MNRPHRLCVVEADTAVRKSLVSYLSQNGLQPQAMASAEEMFSHLARTPSDLLVMEVTLPGMSGLEACQRLRQRGDPIAIILLTDRTDEADRVIGLEMGADDYVHKPYSARELLARVRAVLRRLQATLPAAIQSPEISLRIGEWTFRPSSRTLHRGDSVRILNNTDFALLRELAASPGRPIERARLLAASLGESAALPRAVDASILRLRRLIEIDPSNPRYLQTVRFHGYMFVPDPL